MENFKLEQEVILSEVNEPVEQEKTKEDSKPNTYSSWQKQKIINGEKDIRKLSEMSYIEDIIQNGSAEDVDSGLHVVSKNSGFNEAFPHLLADLYSKKGDTDKAKEVIIGSTEYRYRDKEMINSLKNLFSLHPETKEEFIKDIKILRPEFYAVLPSELK